jgi:hypothetical protein
MHRVLRPGGEAVIVDLRKDVSLDEIDAYLRKSRRSVVDRWLTNFVFRFALIRRAYTRDEFTRMAEKSRFGRCRIEVDPIGFEVHFSKPAQVAVDAS